VNVVASSENESRGVTMRPFSVHVPLIGFALAFSSTYMRMAHTSSVRPAAK
jgi:hypothetical protein